MKTRRGERYVILFMERGVACAAARQPVLGLGGMIAFGDQRYARCYPGRRRGARVLLDVRLDGCAQFAVPLAPTQHVRRFPPRVGHR